MRVPDATAAKVLVVANRTAASDELLAALRDRAQGGPVELFLLVPATPHGLTWTTGMHAARDDARQHAEAALRRFRAVGLEVADARIGDPDPISAVADATAHETFDEIYVSTLPRPISSWLNFSVPRRLEWLVGVPVTHVVATKRTRHIAPDVPTAA